MKNKVVYIRADANPTVATGHVMRCLTIAERLHKQGCTVVFVTADHEADSLLFGKGYEQICLNTDWKDMTAELTPFVRLLKSREGADSEAVRPTVLVDSYQASPSYLAALSEAAKTAYIDDEFKAVYDVDLLINYNLYCYRFPYAERYAGSKTRLLLGGQYVPIRKEFARAAAQTGMQCQETGAAAPENGRLAAQHFSHTADFSKVRNILLICGGGDLYRVLEEQVRMLTGMLPEVLANLRRAGAAEDLQYRFHVVAGRYNPSLEKLRQYAQSNPQFQVYENVSNMAELMTECDVAVSAASTVLYECCAIGLPTVFYCLADNQQYDREGFEKDGLMLYGGDIRNDRTAVQERCLRMALELAADDERRERMKQHMAGVIDTNGAKRIADALLQL